jgi:hypothetical protein
MMDANSNYVLIKNINRRLEIIEKKQKRHLTRREALFVFFIVFLLILVGAYAAPVVAQDFPSVPYADCGGENVDTVELVEQGGSRAFVVYHNHKNRCSGMISGNHVLVGENGITAYVQIRITDDAEEITVTTDDPEYFNVIPADPEMVPDGETVSILITGPMM